LAKDQPGVLAEMTAILGTQGISIEAIIQKEPREGDNQATIIMLTHQVKEGDMNQAIAAMEALDVTCGEIVRIRVETLG